MSTPVSHEEVIVYFILMRWPLILKYTFFTLALALTSSAFALDPLENLPAKVAMVHKALIDNKTCQPDVYNKSEKYPLSPTINLFIVTCNVGSYQDYSRIYITESGDELVRQISLLSFNPQINGQPKYLNSSLDWGGASFDPKSQNLYTHEKSRPVGDCGQSSISKISIGKFGGFNLKTIEIRNKDKCDNNVSSEWPIVYKQ
jgi:hypothetical protein